MCRKEFRGTAQGGDDLGKGLGKGYDLQSKFVQLSTRQKKTSGGG